MSGAAGDRHDADRLLAGYRTARTQETLFDLRPGGGSTGPGIGYDEFLDQDGQRTAGLDRAGRHASPNAAGPG